MQAKIILVLEAPAETIKMIKTVIANDKETAKAIFNKHWSAIGARVTSVIVEEEHKH